MTLGERLRATRTLVVPTLSTKELDRLAGITEGHTWWIESKGAAEGSKKGIETGTADKLAKALGITLEYLIRGEGPEPTAAQVSAAVEEARARLASANSESGEHAAVEAPATGTDGDE